MYYVKIDPVPESLYTAVFDLYLKETPKLITSGDFQTELGAEVVEIHQDPEKARRIARAARKHLGPAGINKLRYVYAAECEDFEGVIFRYLKYIFSHGGAAAKNMAAPDVMAFEYLCRRVSIECHRLKGFVRFQSTESGIYYAKIEPDYNVMALIMPFFCQRFPNQDFLIHDARRNLVGISHGKKRALFSLEQQEISVQLAEEEREFQRLFKEYYQHISIAERRNIKLMRGFMPRRYHRNLMERDELL